MALDDVVILNVDTNTLETPFDDLQSLPNDVVGNEMSLWGSESWECMWWGECDVPLWEKEREMAMAFLGPKKDTVSLISWEPLSQ